MNGTNTKLFNPLASLGPKSRCFGADCDMVAAALAADEGADGEDRWTTSARLLTEGLIRAQVNSLWDASHRDGNDGNGRVPLVRSWMDGSL